MKTFVSLILMILTSQAMATPIHLVAKGIHSPTDGAAFYSCLALQGCELTTYKIGAHQTLHIYTAKSLQTILDDLSRCELSSANVSYLAYYNVNDKILTQIKPKTGKKLNLAPAIYSNRELSRFPQYFEKVIQNKSISNLAKVIDIKNALKINMYGYKILFSNLGTNALAVTEHEKKTITIDTKAKLIEIPRAIRHEYDHVLQAQVEEACSAKGIRTSTFKSHIRREKAAYLNDAQFDHQSDKSWYLKQIEEYERQQ